MSGASKTDRAPGDEPVTATLDAGEQNCATLVLNVRKAIGRMDPGQVLAVIAYDPSAHLDLHAWSRMTGHGFLGMEQHDTHAIYYLRKRGDPNGEHPGVRQPR